MTIRRGCILSAMFLLLAVWGCRTPQSDPTADWRSRLSLRQEGAAKSTKLYQQGMEAYESKDRPKARSLLTEAVTADSRNAHAWVALGVVEMEMDNLFDAAVAFHRAARLQPSRYEPHYNVGLLYESLGRYQRAAEAYESALELAPDQTEVMENLARCYIRSGTKLDRAKELIDRALQKERRPEWREWLERQSLRLASRQGRTP